VQGEAKVLVSSSTIYASVPDIASLPRRHSYHAKRGVGQGKVVVVRDAPESVAWGCPASAIKREDCIISAPAPYKWMNESWEQHCVRAEPTLPFCL
jgi:hypothetical protein